MRIRTAIALCVGMTFATTAPAALAQEQPGTAAELFRAGAAAHERGDHHAAAVAFEQANLLAPRAATLFNAALSWDAAGDKPRAADDFARALEMPGLTSVQSAAVKKRLAELRRSLALLHVRGPEGLRVSVGHVQNASVPLDIHLAPGPVELQLAHSDGTTSTETAALGAGEERVLTFEPRAVSAPHATVQIPPPEPAPEGGPTSLQWWAIGSFGAAVASAGVATFTGIQALSAKSDFEKSGYTDVDAHDRAASFRTVTNVAWAASAVFAVTGVALLLWPSGAPARPTTATGALELHLAPGHIGCAARW